MVTERQASKFSDLLRKSKDVARACCRVFVRLLRCCSIVLLIIFAIARWIVRQLTTGPKRPAARKHGRDYRTGINVSPLEVGAATFGVIAIANYLW